MKIKNNKKFNLLIISIILVLIFISVLTVNMQSSKAKDFINQENYLALNTNTEDVVYLSDISYLKAQIGWGKLIFDSNLSLYVNGSVVSFSKGIFAHATSTLDYDLSAYQDYTYFTTYYGVNSSQTAGNGVKFYIYLSTDNKNWVLQTEENPSAMKGTNEAKYVKIDIRGYKYLRLFAYDNGANGNDHSLWADAKLVKEDYREFSTTSPEEYDEIIKASYTGNIDSNMELMILQREFVSSVGWYQLKTFLESSSEHQETFDWLFNDLNALKLFIVGGKPDGSYLSALNVLNDLYQQYKGDLNDDTVLTSGILAKDLYLKMMLSLSLTHSTTVGLWTGPKNNYNASTATRRYAIYKNLEEQGLLVSAEVGITTNVFETLTVEEMRWVMNNIIDDEEIEWLNNYARVKKSINPYSFLSYRTGYNYQKTEYYSDANYPKWNSKYLLEKYGVSYMLGYPKLWIVFEEGGVCGAISKTGCNLVGVFGLPSSVVHQPGHAAYIYMLPNANGDGVWYLYNDVSGWSQSGYTEVLGIRMPNGWGNRLDGYATNKEPGIQPASYVLLAQAAQNEYAKYEKAEITLLLTSVYQNDKEKLYEIYNKALMEENINFDAWLGLVRLYLSDEAKTEADYYNLAERIVNSLTYYPLPMHDLLRMFSSKFTSPIYITKYSILYDKALKTASVATNEESIQASAVRDVAKALLGQVNNTVATFSFDGDDAETISLSSKYDGVGVVWDYSIDGGNTWVQTDEHNHKLTKEEIENIKDNTDIWVHIIGTDYNVNNIYIIDITKQNKPILYNNDLENKVMGVSNSMEWQIIGTDTWTPFADSYPNLEGNVTINVRTTATKTMLGSDEVSLTYTLNNEPDTQKYIPISHESIYQVSSEQTNKNCYAAYAIDGNINTLWHTSYDGSDTERYIIIKLDSLKYVSALEYVPRGSGSNGILKSGTVSISENAIDWQVVGTITNWANNNTTKTINLDTSNPSRYVKLQATANYGDGRSFLSARMINLFEDTTKRTTPMVELSYDIDSPTKEDVTVKLVNPSTHITITNNDGLDTYTFTDNGEFTFEFVDDYGISSSITATVDWIDKVLPTATLKYSKTTPTNGEVVATITFSEEVELIDNTLVFESHEDGTHTLTFDNNNSYNIKFKDRVGNIGSIDISVDWIDKVIPSATINYSESAKTFKDVVATLVPSEEVKILNNNGLDTYTFMDNGEFTFEFVDMAGNRNSVTATVNNIIPKPKVEIIYSNNNLTNQNVVATITSDEEITVTNNYGFKNYTFTDNGEFKFTYTDTYGRLGEIVATVDWIDKERPIAEVTYDINTLTNQNVVATLIPNEEITIINNDGLNAYTFTNNGIFTFNIQDKAGNTNTVEAKVNWIDKVIPSAKVVYSTLKNTTGSVTARLINPSKEITIINNNGSNTYTFKENGTFEFIYQDSLGNIGKTTAKVTWIVDKIEENNRNNEVNENQEDTKTSNEKETNKNILNYLYYVIPILIITLIILIVVIKRRRKYS